MKLENMPEWMQLLARKKNNEDFSQLCHEYFKLATMRVMQSVREEYKIPPEEVPTLVLAVFARFLNEGCYAVGAHIKNGTPLNDILSKEQQLTLLTILNGDPLYHMDRSDINIDINQGLKRFKEFIMKNGEDFRI